MDDDKDIGELLGKWNSLTALEREQLRDKVKAANDAMRHRQVEDSERRSYHCTAERPTAPGRAASAAVTAPAAPTEATIVRSVLAALRGPMAAVVSTERQRHRTELVELEARIVAKLEEAEGRLLAEISRRVSEEGALSLAGVREDLKNGFTELLRQTDAIAARYEPTRPPNPSPRYWYTGPAGLA